MHNHGYLGIDVGSISTNLVVISPDGEVLFQTYRRVDGDPIASVQKALPAMRDELPDGFRISGHGSISLSRVRAALAGGDCPDVGLCYCAG